LILTFRQVDHLDQQEQIANSIEQTARELSYLSNDYLLNREAPQLARWQSKFDSLSNDINRLSIEDPRQRLLAEQIQVNATHLQSVFSDVSKAIQTASIPGAAQADELEFTRVSWSRLEVQNQNIIFNASLLAQRLLDEEDQLRQTSILLVYALAAIFAGYLLSNYLLIYRRVLQALARLQAGTRMIGAGKLTYQIDDLEKDEFGELSRAFNQMTTNLREITTSKIDLEREIAERQLAEEALIASEARLRQLVDAEIKAQAALAEYAEKLKSSNQELEQFAFIASHDLKEPLRKIRTVGEMIERRMTGKLDVETQGLFIRLLSAAERMQAMIDDLLELSRAGRRDEPFIPVSLTDLAGEVISDLEVRIRATGGQVEILPLPVIEADPLQMRQLLQNLIGNALKYHQPGVQPQVKVWCQEETPMTDNRGAITLYVQDNGIGFKEEYVSKIFMPFTRLHGRDAYEGTGMGLAICQKIVDRHHGKITAHSTPGTGSTFMVTLPMKQPEG
jgi:signal transduction histidine kinase